jgi:hypothetical protein
MSNDNCARCGETFQDFHCPECYTCDYWDADCSNDDCGFVSGNLLDAASPMRETLMSILTPPVRS